MAFNNHKLVVLLIICQNICYVMAAECTTAIVASVFGTIGGLLVIAAIVALVWYCCRRRDSTSFSSASSADSVSDPEFSFGTKTKGGNIGLNGNGTPVTFSHCYSEKAPSTAYNTSGVVNPAFAGGGREVLIDVPHGHHDEVKIDLDGDPSLKPPAHNGEVKIDMDGGSGFKLPSGSGDAKLDMDWDHGHIVDIPDGNRPELNLPEASGGLSGSSLPGNDANVIIRGPSKPKQPKISESIPSVDSPQETVDVSLERPGNGGFGLLIARDKTLPPPALFIREVTPGGIAAKTGLVEKGDKIIAINDKSIEGMPHDQAMSLLRDDNKKILKLTLMKKELYKIKGRSFDRPDGSIEESYKVDISPELEAGLPALDVEGVQGRAPHGVALDISERKPDISMGKPHLDMPEGKLKTQVSGPDTFTDVDLGKPSYGLVLPSSKKKSTKCFSCASSGDRDEPYIKGKSNVGMDLSTPDMTAAIPKGDFNIKRPKGDLSGPEFDASRPKMVLPGPEMDLNRPSADVPKGDFNIKGPKGDLSGPEFDASRPQMGLPGPEVDLNGPSADVSKVAFNIKGPKGDLSGPEFDASRPKMGLPGPEIDVIGPSADFPEGDFNIKRPKGDLSGPEFDASRPKMRLSGLEMDLSGPSADVSEGDFNIKGPSGPEFDASRPKTGFSGPEFNASRPSADFSVDGKTPDVKFSTGKSGLQFPSRDFNGPDGQMEMRAGSNFDISGSGPGIRRPDVGDTQKEYEVRASAPDVNLDVDKGRYSGDVSLPPSHVAAKSPWLGPSSAEINLPSRKKKLGNCLKCTGNGKKDEPYTKNYGYEFDGKDVDRSIEMKQSSGPSIDASGPDVEISKKRPGAKLDTNAQDFNASEGKLSTEISDPNANLSTSRVKGFGVSVDVPSSEVELPSAKRKGGSCFSRAGNGDKDEPYRTNKGKTDFDWSAPEVDGSLKTKKPGDLDISGSGPDFSGRGKNKDLGYKATGPDFNFRGPNKGISTEAPKMTVGTTYPHDKSADVSIPSGNINAGVSGPEIDLSGPRAEVPKGDFNIKGPKGNLSGPEFDASLPKTGRSGPDIDLSGPSADFPEGDFNIKRPKGDLSGPEFDVSRPNMGLSGPEMDLSGPSADLPQGDFKIKGPKGDFSGPEFGASRLKADASVEEANLDLTGKPKVSGPDLEVSTGKIKDLKINLDPPTAELSFSSTKKRKGGNCLSCTGGADKEEPYGKKAVDANFDLEGPNVDFSGPEFDARRPKTRLSGPETDLNGPSADVPKRDFHIKGPKGDLSGSEIDASCPNTGPSGPEIDLSRPSADVSKGDFNIQEPKGDLSGPEFDANRPKMGFSRPEKDPSGPSADVPKDDFNVKGPKGDFSGPEFDASRPKTGFFGPEFSASGPGSDVSGPKFDVSGLKGDASIEEPNVDITGRPKVSVPDLDVSTEKLKDPKVNLDTPSAELDLPSRKKIKGENCLSCTAAADKDEPYGKKSSNTHFGLEGPNVDGRKLDLKLRSVTPNIDSPNVGGDADISVPNASLLSTSGGGKIHGGRGPGVGVGFDPKAPDLEKPKEKLQADMPERDVKVSTGDVKSPRANLHGDFSSQKKSRGTCLSCAGNVDKEEPYGRPSGNSEFKPEQPEFDGALGVKKAGSFDLHEPNTDSKDPARKINTPDFDLAFNKPKSSFQTPELDLNVGNKGEIDISGQNFTPESPGTFTGIGDKDIELRGPDLDVDRSQDNADWGISGAYVPDAPSVAIDGPSISSGDLDTDANVPGIGISGSKPSFELDTNAFDTETDVPASDPRFGASKPDFDTNVDHPDLDISARKPQFGLKEFDMDKSEPEIPTSDFNFDGSLPGLSGGGLDKNMKTGEYLDIDLNRPDIKGYDMDIPEPEIAVGDANFDGALSELDASVKRPVIGFGDRNLDLDVSQPSQDIPAPKKLDTPEPNGEWSFQPRGKDYDGNFDWSVNTSTPKQKGSYSTKLELETEPIAVANNYNLELQSIPMNFPSVEYEEPRSLQRYDEIRPDMELRLLSPKKTDHSEPSFDFETPDSSLDMGKDEPERKPGRMSLIKVEENVTICSASLEEDELPSPRKRTLTLDKEIKQKIEVFFPGEEDSDRKQKSSCSSSPSSSSDTDENKEKKEKRKKKLLKAFRKSSTSSASSKDDKTPKRKEKERKASRSASSSKSDEKGKPKSLKGDLLPVGTAAHTMPKKRKSFSNSSSSDNETDKKRSVKQKDPKQPKTSTSSTSSSDEDHSKTKLPEPSEDASALVKYNVEYTAIPKQYLVSAETEGPRKPQSSVPTVVSHIREDKPENEERKNSTSSSSDESTPKQKMSPKDPQPSMLYKVEYFTNQQKYIIEPHDDLDKPELSAAEVHEDASKVEFYSVKTEDPKFSFIESKKRKSSTSSSSSEKGASDVPEVTLKVESPSIEPKDPSLFFTKPKERKSSISSSSSEESDRLSPNLEVSVDRHETVHHVSTHDQVEDPLVVVTRSLKRTVPEIEEQGEPEHSSIQFTEPPMNLAYHLEYPYNIKTRIDDNNKHIQEEGISPIVSSTLAEYEVPDLSIMLQPDDGHSKDEDKAGNGMPADEKDRSSPTMDIQAHTFETVYQVNIPERPATDKDELEIQEHSPVVVLRSIKKISPGHDDLEEDTQLFTSNADVQSSEPSNDVQLDYPEGYGSFTFDDYRLPKTDEEWIVKHSVKKDIPDIEALAGSLDYPENNDKQNVYSNQDKDTNEKSPRDASSARRNSNSRLWDLMQGYLIERPIVDDDDDNTKPDPEKTTEVKNEEDSKPKNVERAVYNITVKPVKFDTVDVQVQANDNKEPDTKMSTPVTQVESGIPKVTSSDPQFDIVTFQPDVKEQHTVLETAPVPKVESVMPKATSSVSQFEPVAVQLDVGGKQPIVKEPQSTWKKQASLPSDTDDSESDPWMRHYSKGLYQRGHHQPPTTKLTEKESTGPHRQVLSLSKVPHVKGVRSSAEQPRERSRYSIEGLARIEPVSYPSVTDRNQTRTSRQEPSNRPSVSSLRSFWDK